jgi:hypothetical protein
MSAENKSKLVQLDAFRSHEQAMQEEFKARVDKSIKGLYARYNDLEYACIQIQDQIEDIRKDVARVLGRVV